MCGFLRAAAAALLLIGCSAQNGAGPAVGTLVPDFEMTTLDGEAVTLSQWRGKTVVLNVWAPWCPPCVAEMPSLDRLAKQLSPEHFAVVALAPDDDRFLLEEFLVKHPVGFGVFLDAKGTAIPHVLGVAAFPQTFIVDVNGRLRERVVGQRRWDESPMRERILAWGSTPEKEG